MSSRSSSHPPSTPSPPYSPFSYLPFELAEDIIEATLPRHHNPNTYAERQETLLTLCLVSRLFHQISKPLLFAVVRIDSRSGHSWLSISEEEEVDRAPQIRELIVYCPGETVRFDDLRTIFLSQQHITKLVLLDVPGEVDFGTLSQMNHLSILRLFHVTITATSSFAILQLSELSLFYVHLAESWTSNFDSRCFPSLRAVSISASPDDTSGSSLAQKILEVLSTQVDVISIDIGVISRLSPNLFARIQHKTLLEISTTLPKLSVCVSHLRFRTELSASEEKFDGLIEFVSQMPSSTSPTLLYLPRHLKSVNTDSIELQISRQSSLNYGSAKKVEVIFEEQLQDWFLFCQVSADFRGRMKEKKVQQL